MLRDIYNLRTCYQRHKFWREWRTSFSTDNLVVYDWLRFENTFHLRLHLLKTEFISCICEIWKIIDSHSNKTYYTILIKRSISLPSLERGEFSEYELYRLLKRMNSSKNDQYDITLHKVKCCKIIYDHFASDQISFASPFFLNIIWGERLSFLFFYENIGRRLLHVSRGNRL